MIPSIDDRLASVVRALSEVILPHLPEDASLAHEQGQLAIGHLQILRAQIDQAPGFERAELEDYLALARELSDSVSNDAQAHSSQKQLQEAIDNTDHLGVREQRRAVNEAVEALIRAVFKEGDEAARASVSATILAHEEKRTRVDREWFAPFGFDTLDE
jgi:hypothetical protein